MRIDDLEQFMVILLRAGEVNSADVITSFRKAAELTLRSLRYCFSILCGRGLTRDSLICVNDFVI